MAIDLDGTDDYVRATHIAALQVTTAASFAAWVNLDAISAETVISKGADAADPDYVFQIARVSTGELSVYDGSNWKDGTTSVITSTGIWYHVAATFDDANWRFYVNGAAQGVVASTTNIQTSTGDLTLGGQGYDIQANFMNGRIEDARVFNRTLTVEEVAMLAAGYRGPLGGEVGWWSCQNFRAVTHPDGTTITTQYLRDESGGGATGNPEGGVIARASDAPSAFPMWVGAPAGDLTRDKDLTGALSWVGTVAKSTALRQIVLFFATVRSLFKGHDQDDVLSAPERSRKHKG